MSDFSGLSIDGRIATPSDPDWDEARAAWNLVADQRPEAVAFVESAEDVAKTVGFAAEHDLEVAGQGSGHGAVALGSLEDTILLKTERLRGIEVDADARTARVEAGVLVLELSEAAQAHGLSSMPGSSPDVGVTGYTLGGGLSWLGRRYGFACNRVRAIELVTADGEARTVDAENDPNLFWALRGGGGGYAIVTALHLDLVPIGETYAGALLFPAEAGAEGVRIYRDWAATVSDDVTSVVRFLPDEAIDAFVGYAGPVSGSPLLLAELRQLGGVLARPAEGGGALDKIDAAFVMLAVGLPMTPELGQAIEGHLDRLPEAMRPWAAHGGYFNFAERPCDADAILPAETCARLVEVKRRYDPESRIVANHAVSLDSV